MLNAESIREIHRQIVQDTQSCETLLQLLSEEREALKARDMDALERILSEKTVHLTALEENGHKRASLAEKAPDSQQKWQAMLEQTGSESLQSDWQKLKELMARCRQENQVNGKILARNHQVYARLVELVCGNTAAPSLYDAKGHSSGSGSSSIVGEA